MEEIWRSVCGYEGYYIVSNLGAVRALDRKVVRKDGVVQLRKGHLMVQTPNSDGYPMVNLSRNGNSKRIAVHVVVAEAFLQKPDDRRVEVNHIDCNRTNCSVENLEWVTHAENVAHAIKSGHHVCTRDLRGANNPNYRSTTLRDYYAAHPEQAQIVLARPGAQNGRAKAVRMTGPSGNVVRFGYIRECAQYLIDTGISSSSSLSYTSDMIVKAIHSQSLLFTHYFEFENAHDNTVPSP